MIISKRMSQHDTRKKKKFSSNTERFQKDELYRNSQLAIAWTDEHCQYVDSLMAIDFSHTATRNENNYSLGVNGQGPKPWTNEKRTEFPQAMNKLLDLRKQVENPSPYTPKHLRFPQRPIEERERLEEQWKRWRWNKWSQSSSSSTTWWTPQERQERQGKFIFFRVKERTTVFFQGLSLTSNSDSLVSDGDVNSTPHRASVTCHTRNFSRRVHVVQDDRGILLDAVCVFLESHSISSRFHRTLLDSQLSPHFSTTFPTLAPGSSTSPSLFFPSMSPSTATLQGGSCFGRLAEQSLPDTLRSSYLREEAVSLTISRPLWMRLKSTAQQSWDG